MINGLKILVFFVGEVLVLRKEITADLFEVAKEDLLVECCIDFFGVWIIWPRQVYLGIKKKKKIKKREKMGVKRYILLETVCGVFFFFFSISLDHRKK